MWHQDDCSETQEAQAVRVHPHCPERKTGRDKTIDKRRARDWRQSIISIKSSKEVEYAAYTPTLNVANTYNIYYPPVKERGEDDDTEDAGGQDVEDVG